MREQRKIKGRGVTLILCIDVLLAVMCILIYTFTYVWAGYVALSVILLLGWLFRRRINPWLTKILFDESTAEAEQTQ